MSWHFSRALEAAYLADTCSAGEPSAPWKSTPTPLPSLWRAKTMGTFHRSPFGMMCVPLTDTRGADLLTWFRAAFLAKTSAQRGAAPELPDPKAGSGDTCTGSFAKYDRVSCSWKTPQLSLHADWVACSVTWPPAGTMRNGECWPRATLAPPMNAAEYGLLLPTPTATANMMAPSIQKWRRHRNLLTVPTPTASPSGRNRSASPNAKIRPSLGMMARRNLWPDQAESQGVVGGALNPAWIEWLMGWPIGWADLKPLATDRFRLWLHAHGKS